MLSGGLPHSKSPTAEHLSWLLFTAQLFLSAPPPPQRTLSFPTFTHGVRYHFTLLAENKQGAGPEVAPRRPFTSLVRIDPCSASAAAMA